MLLAELLFGFVNANQTVRVQRVEPRYIRGDTPIRGAIVTLVPPERTDAKLVNEVERALRQYGATVERAMQDADPPDLLRRGGVVALGHAWNNRIVRRLYYEMYDWTDAAWPSRGGYALRTIVDPYAPGNDVIRVAYSDDRDAKRAIKAFLSALDKMSADSNLPYLHPVKLGELEPIYARFLNPLLEPTFQWRHEDNTWDLQVQSSHLGLGYLFTGREGFLVEFRRRFLRYLEHNSARGCSGSHGFMHHITLPYFLTEHHTIWSLDDRKKAVNHILEVFLSSEGIKFDGFLAGTRSNDPRDNHATRAALDNFIHARYFHLPEAKEGLALVDRFFRWQFHCSKPQFTSSAGLTVALWFAPLNVAT
ncbi:MAG: hypothetical protein NZT92_06760 [Abditibacteriales bacterium]|nr:hypothetical protein [Abditibacteriales bacterium]